MSGEARIAYGARCTWWGSISEVGSTSSGLPCCPRCGGSLFEMDDIESWWLIVDQHEATYEAGYRAMIEWARGQCFAGWPVLRAAYAARDEVDT